ncbi:TerC family protein [Xanthobacter sp. KR7-65]|uniref:TerC family protein n=1 Tax=Xanthobacter sp. KR7-65 TaxID=3156612 RepID=UPI0032B5C3F6
MLDFLTADALAALMKVIMIDLVLAGDNAIVIGLAAAGLPAEQRARAIMIGIVAATLMRIGFASVTTQLLSIFGLMLAGGLLLLWVCWKMWRELREQALAHELVTESQLNNVSVNSDGTMALNGPPKKTFLQATWVIIVADVSMSLDNVLAVAGAAREHPWVLIFGLALSIALMGAAATYIARLLQKHRWIAYAGLAVILYVALDMIYRGGLEVWPVARAWAASF